MKLFSVKLNMLSCGITRTVIFVMPVLWKDEKMTVYLPALMCTLESSNIGLVIALSPQTPKLIRGGWSHYTDTSEPVDGGVLWTTRTILSVKMDRENSLTLLWPEWGSNPIPSDPQSDSNRLCHRPGQAATFSFVSFMMLSVLLVCSSSTCEYYERRLQSNFFWFTFIGVLL
jgi:hypothetical protein